MGIIDYVGDNSVQIDAIEYEKKLRLNDPKLLLNDERIILAFKGRGGSGRDKRLLTTHRLLIRDKRGMTGKRICYTSVPYDSIGAFSVETAGTFDGDSELNVHARGIGKVSIEFSKTVDVISIFRHLGRALLTGGRVGHATNATMGGMSSPSAGGGGGGGIMGILDVLGTDYAQIDNGAVEMRLRCDPTNVLIEDERVEMAFKCGRDLLLFTSHRVLRIDVKGISGKKGELHVFFETAGNILDRDSELVLFFNLPDSPNMAEGFPRNSRTRMKIDFRSGGSDILAVQRYISDKLLGPDTVAPSRHARNAVPGGGGGASSSLASMAAGIFSFLGDDNRMVDPKQANYQFHSEQPILQGCETVELAFKGRRDMLLFTTKRVVFVDMQGFMGLGKKVSYVSLPYSTITAFSVRSAGSWADKDSELNLWLDFDDVFNPPRESEDDPPPPPIPRNSYLEIDFQKDKVDILVVHRYLSERVMRTDGHNMKPYTNGVPPNLLVPSPPGSMQNLLDWIGDNASAIDPEAVNRKFHEAGILQTDERVAFAFKTGRDSLYLTNKRFFMIDVQGFTGKRKEYMSVPWDSVRVWSVESAGNFDRDMELRLWFKGAWNNKIKQDLRKGKSDIFAIQSFISHFVIGPADGKTALSNAQSYVPPPSGAATKFLGFLNDAHMKDATELTSTLRSSPALLQQDESCEAAFKCGRDMFIISTKRIIIIDKKGITGKSVEYTSYPLSIARAFEIETEGHLLNGAQVKIYADNNAIEQELAKGQNNGVWLMHEMLSNKVLKDPQKEIGAIATQLASLSVAAPKASQSLPSPAAPSYQPYQPLPLAPEYQPHVSASAYQLASAPPEPEPFTFGVKRPLGVEPGNPIRVKHPKTGVMLVVTVPHGCPPGGVFNVTA
ncbi:hypothetical protein ACHAXA_005483 [Cyclostephanos tholiformis]|uniref:Bacterial Pleckstrin homology domain-containing protein n=1 Tax=Cyclostephanos tholiformis TaxID=382380 RepID=A0ABD3SHJ6_9STRA